MSLILLEFLLDYKLKVLTGCEIKFCLYKLIKTLKSFFASSDFYNGFFK